VCVCVCVCDSRRCKFSVDLLLLLFKYMAGSLSMKHCKKEMNDTCVYYIYALLFRQYDISIWHKLHVGMLLVRLHAAVRTILY
jgi:hypothetical protein